MQVRTASGSRVLGQVGEVGVVGEHHSWNRLAMLFKASKASKAATVRSSSKRGGLPSGAQTEHTSRGSVRWSMASSLDDCSPVLCERRNILVRGHPFLRSSSLRVRAARKCLSAGLNAGEVVREGRGALGEGQRPGLEVSDGHTQLFTVCDYYVAKCRCSARWIF